MGNTISDRIEKTSSETDRNSFRTGAALQAFGLYLEGELLHTINLQKGDSSRHSPFRTESKRGADLPDQVQRWRQHLRR